MTVGAAGFGGVSSMSLTLIVTEMASSATGVFSASPESFFLSDTRTTAVYCDWVSKSRFCPLFSVSAPVELLTVRRLLPANASQ